MKIAYILFDGITWLDFIGFYDPISRLKSLGYLPELTWDICSFQDKKVVDNFGLEMAATKIGNPLGEYDVLMIPGGFGTRALRHDTGFIEWIKTAEPVTYKISVCTGSLLLGAAGFLTNKRATTNFLEYETLKPYCREVVRERIVEDETTITAGAVSSSIDLGLCLVERWAGTEAKEEIRRRMDYK